MKRLLLLLVFPAFLLAPSSSDAQEEWEFTLAPYLWVSGLEGNVKTLSGVPQAEIELSFTDILKNLDLAAFAVGGARYGDTFLRGEVSYARVTADATTPGPVFSGGSVTSTTFTGGLSVGRTILRDSDKTLGVFTGFRYWVIKTDVSLNAGLANSRSHSETVNFVDPIVGLSGTYAIAPDWTAFGSATIGGFGVGSDLEWGGSAGVNYQIGDTISLAAGYRYLSIDYDDGDFVYDVDQHGPMIGLTISF
jgi:opacity protein-like surface antigen